MYSTFEISSCTAIPHDIRVIDHEIDPSSQKIISILYQEQFRISRIVEILGGMSDIDSSFRGVLAQALNQTPPLREGVLKIRKTDALGWRMESDQSSSALIQS